MKELEGPPDLQEFAVGEAHVDAEADCDGAIRKSDRGNQTYYWWFLTNGADSEATVTIKRTWIYNGQVRSDTRQHILYPGEEREVFSFPRQQNPRVLLIRCKLAE